MGVHPRPRTTQRAAREPTCLEGQLWFILYREMHRAACARFLTLHLQRVPTTSQDGVFYLSRTYTDAGGPSHSAMKQTIRSLALFFSYQERLFDMMRIPQNTSTKQIENPF